MIFLFKWVFIKFTKWFECISC